jgi:hypothetical protein
VQIWAAAISMAPDAVGITLGRWIWHLTTAFARVLHLT